MKYAILGLTALLALGACTGGALRTPSAVLNDNAQLQTAAANFCREDFVEAQVPAITEGVQIYNILASLIGRDTIETENLFASKAVTTLLTVRGGVCQATQPKPVVVEAIAEAEVEVISDGMVVVDGEVAPLSVAVE